MSESSTLPKSPDLTPCDHCGEVVACDHCGTIEVAIILWPKWIHDQCPCRCHADKTTAANIERQRKKRTNRKTK